jgi:glycosyltransferase involved in cell wall biosynthesis
LNIAIAAPIDIHALARFMGQDEREVVPGQGSNPSTTGLIMELVRRGHVVTLFTLSDHVQKEATYDWGGLRVFVGPNKRFRYLFRPQVSYLRRAIRDDAPRFVHANWTYEFAISALASGVPTVTTIHDLPWRVLRYFWNYSGAYARLAMAYLVALKGTHFTAVSEDAARHFRRWLFVKTPIKIIPNFIGEWIFELGRTGVPRGDRPLTFFTLLQGWSGRKNGKCALIAFQLTRKSYPDARLIMIGADYEAGGKAERWAISKGLAQGVIFQGLMPYGLLVKFVIQEADVLVHPSLDEALSMATSESMALKKPVVAGIKTPGMGQLLDGGRVGFLVDVRNPEEVSKAMNQLAGDPELRKTMAEAAFEHACKNLSADVVVPQYEALYRDFDALVGGESHERNLEVRRT